MKKSISDLYEQILLNEAEKSDLQNPSNDEVGDLPSENMFGTVPRTIKGEGPEKAKLQKGPSYNKVDSGTPVASKQTSSKMPNSKPAKSATPEEGIEMEEDEFTLTDHEDEKMERKPKPQKESFTMSAFEQLFKKTLQEELEEENVGMETADEEVDDMDLDSEMEDEDMPEEEGQEEEEEEDLISDLRGLQAKLNSILDKLESLEDEESEEESEGEEYTEDEFDDEFGSEEEGEEEEEEAPMKESVQSNLKPVNKSKIKTLQSKKNKVGKITAKGGKAKTNNIKVSPNPKALGDKKKVVQSHNNKVRSSVDRGDFFK